MNASTVRLVEALEKAQLVDDDPRLANLVERARTEEFHDFAGPHACPVTRLVGELRAIGHYGLAHRATRGEFDATAEESDAWARSADGQETIRELGEPVARALGFPWPDDEPAKADG